jgi:transposase-like protein
LKRRDCLSSLETVHVPSFFCKNRPAVEDAIDCFFRDGKVKKVINLKCPKCGEQGDDVIGQSREDDQNTWYCSNCGATSKGVLVECGGCQRRIWIEGMTVKQVKSLEYACKLCQKTFSIAFWGIWEHRSFPGMCY